MGRPGWHIECSAMAGRFLGDTIDIHCGGKDLIFPHHENEIAQSEAATGKPFARFWLHNGFISVDNEKMSKSLNNFFTVRDVAEKYGYETIRFFMLSAHYRSPLNYSVESLEQAKAALERMYGCRDSLNFMISNSSGEKEADFEDIVTKLDSHKSAFLEALEDDFNTADAIASIFELVRDINTYCSTNSNPSKELCSCALDELNELTGVLGLMTVKKDENIDAEIEALIEKRQQARKNKDFKLADSIRNELKQRGIILEDTNQGVKWRKE
jgi:cysteinyl-tRNA synthetase